MKYLCPRCGYQSDKKTDMNRHFVKRKDQCKPKLSSIELTPEVVNSIINKTKGQIKISDVDIIRSNNLAQQTQLQQRHQDNCTTTPQSSQQFMDSSLSIKFKVDSISMPTQNIVNINNTQINTHTHPQHINPRTNIENVNNLLPYNQSNLLNCNLIDTTAGPSITPLHNQSGFGKNVLVLYAKSSETSPKMPIRVVIDSGSRKIHLFDFIRAMTECSLENVENEWKYVQSNLEETVNRDMLTAQKYQFPRLDDELTGSDSMVIDIRGAAKVARAIGARANWFNEILTSLDNSSSAGDPEVDIQYMNIVQRMSEYEPDNFLRLWGEEFLANTSVAHAQRKASYSENLFGSMAATTPYAVSYTHLVDVVTVRI